MTRILAAALVALVVALVHSSSASAASGNLFICKTKDIQQLGEDGRLERNELTEQLLKHTLTVYFDEVVGLLRYGGLTVEMKVIQQGSEVNNSVGLFEYHGSGSSGVDVFKVDTLVDGMPFIYLEQEKIYTGSCKVSWPPKPPPR